MADLTSNGLPEGGRLAQTQDVVIHLVLTPPIGVSLGSSGENKWSSVLKRGWSRSLRESIGGVLGSTGRKNVDPDVKGGSRERNACVGPGRDKGVEGYEG